MAHWFLQIFLWYGLVAQFQQIRCFPNTGGGTSSSKKVFDFELKHNRSGSNLQREKGFMGLIEIEELLANINDPNYSPSFYSPSGVTNKKQFPIEHPTIEEQTGWRIPRNRKLRTEGLKYRYQEYKSKRRLRNSLRFSNQVPDDDFEDDGRDQSGENEDVQVPSVERLPTSKRYFYRNGSRMLVRSAQEESDDFYYRRLNKGVGQEAGLRIDQQQNDDERANQRMETVLHVHDAFNKPKNSGPIFKNSMIWVNMMRASRGWFPEGTSE